MWGVGVALVPISTEPNDKLLLLHAFVETWLGDTLGIRTLYTLLGQTKPMQLEEIQLAQNKKAMRNAAVGILFKTKQRKRKWNAPKGHWMNRLGQRVDRPKWLGENAFVADFWHIPLQCIPLHTAQTQAAVEFPTFEVTGPPLPQKELVEMGRTKTVITFVN